LGLDEAGSLRNAKLASAQLGMSANLEFPQPPVASLPPAARELQAARRELEAARQAARVRELEAEARDRALSDARVALERREADLRAAELRAREDRLHERAEAARRAERLSVAAVETRLKAASQREIEALAEDASSLRERLSITEARCDAARAERARLAARVETVGGETLSAAKFEIRNAAAEEREARQVLEQNVEALRSRMERDGVEAERARTRLAEALEASRAQEGQREAAAEARVAAAVERAVSEATQSRLADASTLSARLERIERLGGVRNDVGSEGGGLGTFDDIVADARAGRGPSSVDAGSRPPPESYAALLDASSDASSLALSTETESDDGGRAPTMRETVSNPETSPRQPGPWEPSRAAAATEADIPGELPHSAAGTDEESWLSDGEIARFGPFASENQRNEANVGADPGVGGAETEPGEIPNSAAAAAAKRLAAAVGTFEARGACVPVPAGRGRPDADGAAADGAAADGVEV
jgi:hypothetical protein